MRSRVSFLSSPVSAVMTLAAVAACAIMGVSLFVVSASAVAAGPAWRIVDETAGATMPAGGSGFFELQVENTGDASTDGSPVTVVDHLPAGLTATAVGGMEYQNHGLHFEPGDWECGGVGTSTVTCVNDPNVVISYPVASGYPSFQPTYFDGWGLDNRGCNAATFTFCFPGGGASQAEHEAWRSQPPSIGIGVSVAGSARGTLTDDATVSGGGAPAPASDSSTIDVTPEQAQFGVQGARVYAINADGTPDTQAGSHLYSVSAVLKFNLSEPEPHAGAAGLRSVHAELPAGLIGNPQAYPECPQQVFEESRQEFGASACPVDTQVGIITLTISGTNENLDIPIYSLVPGRGEAARFGVALKSNSALFSASVGPGPGHNLELNIPDIFGGNPGGFHVGFVDATFWGTPADPSHDRQREGSERILPNSSSAPLKPFLALPVECGQPQAFSVSFERWEAEGTGPLTVGPLQVLSGDAQGNPVTLGGCGALNYSPMIATTPTTTLADSPTGIDVNIDSPVKEHEENPAGLAEADLKNATVSLPAGVSVNPAAANGLGACSEAQIELSQPGPGSCPASSKIGTVEIETPLLDHPVPGAIYLARQDENPFHSLLAGYIVIDDPISDTIVKVPGELRTNPETGQITGRFSETPQYPLSSIKLRFFNELATPQACGSYTTTSDLTPWSTPETADAIPSSTFQVTGAQSGGACPGGVLPFAPAFTAGTFSNQAGSYSAFSLSFSRSDGEQHLAGLSVKMPEGLLGKLAGIPLCPEPQASQGQCSSASEIGEADVTAGVGGEPFAVKGGRVYLTGPYNGGPFGLSIVVPAVAGPFNLGNVVVRSSIRIDPATAQVSIVSDPIPQMINSVEGLQSGIPADIRTVNVVISRQGFLFNPTSCEPMSVTGALTGAQGSTAGMSSRFQAAGCQALAFHPSFTVSTQAATSKKNGASLHVVYSTPAGQANTHSVAVTLPKALPARLTTIQQACTEKAFNANPATCPAASAIGTATATTPILSNPVSGPVYLVSHGGAAFPDIVAILQGEGVTIYLTGSIDIKKGVTSSTFASVPDAPIGVFEMTLPEGPHSGLAAVVPAKAKGSLCGQNLTMPTTITAQNGAIVKQTTKIALTGCPKAKTVKKKPKKHKKIKKHRKGRK